MHKKMSINYIHTKKLLSFSDKNTPFYLGELNVLIGPNSCGKSNFIESIRMLKSLNGNVGEPFIRNGSPSDLKWKGSIDKDEIFPDILDDSPEMLIEYCYDDKFIAHRFDYWVQEDDAWIMAEGIYAQDKADNYQNIYVKGFGGPEVSMYYHGLKKGAFAEDEKIKEIIEYENGILIRSFGWEKLDRNNSILSQRNDPRLYPHLHDLSEYYSKIAIFSEANFGRMATMRKPQNTNLDYSYLFEDGSNMAIVLNDLQHKPAVMKSILDKLQVFYENIENIIVRVKNGTIQIYFQEKNLSETIPATRMSDGTLRFLFLLIILMHPDPPPLICIEEPEIGMHPDIIHVIADLLVEASQRTQIVITTHSDILVSAVGNHHPEAIVVCSKDRNGTKMKRLDPEKMKVWLEKYSLGDLWTSGEIGGTRW